MERCCIYTSTHEYVYCSVLTCWMNIAYTPPSTQWTRPSARTSKWKRRTSADWRGDRRGFNGLESFNVRHSRRRSRRRLSTAFTSLHPLCRLIQIETHFSSVDLSERKTKQKEVRVTVSSFVIYYLLMPRPHERLSHLFFFHATDKRLLERDGAVSFLLLFIE